MDLISYYQRFVLEGLRTLFMNSRAFSIDLRGIDSYYPPSLLGWVEEVCYPMDPTSNALLGSIDYQMPLRYIPQAKTSYREKNR